MEYYSPDIPGLSAWSMVKILTRDGRVVIQQRFSSSNPDERSLSHGEGSALLRLTDYALNRPENGWDILFKSQGRSATIVRFNRDLDSSRPGGPGIVRFNVENVRFLFDLRHCAEFRGHLKEALDLLVVSEVIES